MLPNRQSSESELDMTQDTTPPAARRTRGPRVSRACARCRLGKLRCDGQTPACAPCADRGHSCVYPATQRMRGPGKSKQRIEALEGRLAALESRLRLESRTDLSEMALRSPESMPSTHASSSPPNSRDISAFGGLMLPFHQLSQRSTVEECTKPLDRLVMSPLSVEASDLGLIEKFIGDVCAELPFMRPQWFIDQISLPGATGVSEAWWQGITNAITANAIYFKAPDSPFREVAAYAWAFFRNAYAVLPELILNGNNLGAAQAIMAMAMFMRQSADTRATALLFSLAVRIQLSAGLDVKAASESVTSPVDEENRNRLFWAAFIFDMDMAVNTGLPPVNADEVVRPGRPGGHCPQHGALSPPDALSHGGWEDIVFRLRVELAGIQRRIAIQFVAANQAELFALESEIEAWSLRVPVSIRPDWPDKPQSASSDDEVAGVSIAMLHFAYYNSVAMICWAAIRHVASQLVESPRTLDSPIDSTVNDRMGGHKSVARAAARASICCMSRFPTQVFPELWRALCHPVAASIALMALVCKEPTHPEAQGDLLLLSWFAGFLERMVRDEGYDLERMRDGICTFEKVATHAVSAAMTSDMPVNPALWPLTLASGHTGKALATMLTCASYHPMYIAQSFMSNTPNRDHDNAKKLADILGLQWGNNDYGPFVPDSLMPSTYGFTFSSSGLR
ncbi:uncharacterized protein B0H64DRAFT_203880 [Chaetomium fimeti]|uniref:Zn(2)-C6 fungal-type domain-containing protein n=1 Tax=Chaetomium fimeti TaxID=1854472 RepID=A0AAE0HAQ4_9PEZI|nr:hypothetical protein B0H64DRAFT_203880 [Chaetomium fimeti]